MSAFTDIAKLLSDTPLPTILVLSGLFFMLLALADSLIEKISIPERRRSLSLTVGVFLTTVGAILWTLPALIETDDTLQIADTGGDGAPDSTGSTNPVRPPSGGPLVKAYYVQLAAVSSFSAASDAVDKFRSDHSDLLADLTPKVESVDHPEHGTLYRVRFGVFETSGQADIVCLNLRADGLESCRVFADD